MHPAGAAAPEPLELGLERLDLWQHLFGDAQQAHPGLRQPQGLGAAHKQLDPGLVFQPLDLVAQRRLGDVQKVRRPRQPAGLVDGPDRAEVSEINVHY